MNKNMPSTYENVIVEAIILYNFWDILKYSLNHNDEAFTLLEGGGRLVEA